MRDHSASRNTATHLPALCDSLWRGMPNAFATFIKLAGAKAGRDDALSHPLSDKTSASPVADQHAGSAAQRQLRVVIVEDEAIIAMEIAMLLEELGAEVLGNAMSAAQAEAIVAAHQPDLVTMDINIQGDRDGVAAAQAIFDKYGVRSIFISAYSDAATQARATSSQPIGWLKKPVSKASLSEALLHAARHIR